MKYTTVAVAFVAFAFLIPAEAPANGSANAFMAITDLYELARLELVDDSLEGVPKLARAIRFELTSLQDDFSAGQAGVPEAKAHSVLKLIPSLSSATSDLETATGIDKARVAFSKLSDGLVQWHAHATDREKGKVAFCPMVKKSWIQPRGTIGNPYAGSLMPKCGVFLTE